MKILLYYLLLLVAMAVIAGFILSGNGAGMPMPQMLAIAAGLVLYTVAMAFVGETKPKPTELLEQPAVSHAAIANRAALTAAMIVTTLGVLTQLFVSHSVDYWLIIILIGINLAKIISLMYLHYKK